MTLPGLRNGAQQTRRGELANNPKHDILFEPISFDPKTMRNRFWQSAHCTGYGSERPGTQVYFRGMKAEGGWPFALKLALFIRSRMTTRGTWPRLWDEGDVTNLGKMCEELHKHETWPACSFGTTAPMIFS